MLPKVRYMPSPVRVSWRLEFESQSQSENDLLPLNRAVRLVDEMAKMRVFVLTIVGRDIVQDNYLRKLIESASSSGIHVILSTNGDSLDDQSLRYLRKKKIGSLTIHIAGSNEKTHYIVDGTPSYQANIEAIKISKRIGITTNLLTTFCSANIEEMDDIYNLARELQVDTWSLFPLQIESADCDVYPISPLERRDLYVKAKQWINTTNSDVRVFIQDPLAAQITGQNYNLSCFTTCPLAKSMCHIEPNGDIFPCPQFKQRCGNVRFAKFSKIWTDSPEFQQLRQLEVCSICQRCEAFDSCLGGCRAKLYKQNMDITLSDPDCWRLMT